ncbi:MAG: ATP-binding protein [Muribaculaceae bacterium]|nr:ATP-binding protein [Muribaculaceae bacterium]
MDNPFKFGSIVSGNYFTDRVEEQEKIGNIFNSANHLALISPRRFGKTSLVNKVAKETGRTYIYVNLQEVVDVKDFATKIIKKTLETSFTEKIKYYISHLRFQPTIDVDAVTGRTKVTLGAHVDDSEALEDALSLINKIGANEPKNKPIVVFDEFQEINDIGKHLDKKLRSWMQMHEHVNYVFLGSQESMMEEIFENKKSPFYHFSLLMRLKRIPYNEFQAFLSNRFDLLCDDKETTDRVAHEILEITECHPYYTQQLAYVVWDQWERKTNDTDALISMAIDTITQSHSLDYERLWEKFNRTDRRMLMLVANKRISASTPLQSALTGIASQSTAASCMKRLIKQGYIIKETFYSIDDPFFKNWINQIS